MTLDTRGIKKTSASAAAGLLEAGLLNPAECVPGEGSLLNRQYEVKVMTNLLNGITDAEYCQEKSGSVHKRRVETVDEALKQLLGFIIRYKMKNGGNSPSYAEMAAQMNCNKQMINRYIYQLADQGAIIVAPGSTRNISIPGSTWTVPIAEEIRPYVIDDGEAS